MKVLGYNSTSSDSTNFSFCNSGSKIWLMFGKVQSDKYTSYPEMELIFILDRPVILRLQNILLIDGVFEQGFIKFPFCLQFLRKCRFSFIYLIQVGKRVYKWDAIMLANVWNIFFESELFLLEKWGFG